MAKKIIEETNFSGVIDSKTTEKNKKEILEEFKPTIKKCKTEKCKVLAYNKNTRELDVDFKGYGVRLNNVDTIQSDFVLIKYYGEIGKSNFSCEL